jgi:hypothetical protein
MCNKDFSCPSARADSVAMQARNISASPSPSPLPSPEELLSFWLTMSHLEMQKIQVLYCAVEKAFA